MFCFVFSVGEASVRLNVNEKIEEKVIIKGTRARRQWDGCRDRALGPRERDRP